jgi:hypothetical protein
MHLMHMCQAGICHLIRQAIDMHPRAHLVMHAAQTEPSWKSQEKQIPGDSFLAELVAYYCGLAAREGEELEALTRGVL